jgi:vacuolar-type H+-ATPase subunit H
MTDWADLDKSIDEFEQMVAMATSFLYGPPRDWRPLFDKAQEVQAGFNGRPHYPTKNDRDHAWVRFNDARSLLREHANKAREEFRYKSQQFREEIVDIARSTIYHPVNDILFFFDPTTVEEMKSAAAALNRAGRLLSEHKGEMLKEHKDECFALISEARQSHDFFWGRYKEAREQRQAEFHRKREEFIDRTRYNIRANRERLGKALEAYERVQSNLENNIERQSGARSEEFAARVSEWIADDRAKLDSISESIDRLREWIREDERRLEDALSR